MMGLWPLLIALQCAAVLGHRPARFCPPLGAFLLLSGGLGCFALAPVQPTTQLWFEQPFGRSQRVAPQGLAL